MMGKRSAGCVFSLAGMALVFTCTVTAVRPASEEEIAHGHVHEEGECEND